MGTATKANVTYQEQAYRYVKSQILSCTFTPGQVITDAQIAENLNISRTPVRESFHRLANEGLLIREARRGWRVYSLSLEDVREIFDMKAALEGMLASKAASNPDKTLRQDLQAAISEMAIATKNKDTEAWFAADEKLHNTIFALANNKRAERTIHNLNDQWHRLRIGFAALQSRMDHSITEHQKIVDCILNNDENGAEKAIQEHLGRVRDDLLRLLENIILPFVKNGV